MALKVERRGYRQWENCVSYFSLLSGPFLKHMILMLAQEMGGGIKLSQGIIQNFQKAFSLLPSILPSLCSSLCPSLHPFLQGREH